MNIQEAEIKRLRAALEQIASTAEEYNYIGWQRIVGVMQKRAIEALKPNNSDAVTAMKNLRTTTDKETVEEGGNA